MAKSKENKLDWKNWQNSRCFWWRLSDHLRTANWECFTSINVRGVERWWFNARYANWWFRPFYRVITWFLNERWKFRSNLWRIIRTDEIDKSGKNWENDAVRSLNKIYLNVYITNGKQIFELKELYGNYLSLL